MLSHSSLPSQSRQSSQVLPSGSSLYLHDVDAGNGANFAVIPHIHPSANGIVSGLTGACGNLGGVIFALVFRFNGTDYHKSYWIIGIISLALGLSVCWIRVPKVLTLYLLEPADFASCQVRWDGGGNQDRDIYRGCNYTRTWINFLF
jgi:hypothetical protein